MAKKVNKNLIAGLTALAFIVVTGAGLMIVNQSKLSDPTELVSRAQEFVEAEDWGQAAVYYRRAYQASKDPTYLVRFADMLRSGGNDFEALQQYRDATIVDSQLLEAFEKMLEIELQMADLFSGTKNWVNVKDTAESILALDEQAAHPRALFAKGIALFRLKEQSPEYAEEGIRHLELAVEGSPQEFDFARRLGNCYYVMERNDDAEKLYTDMVARTNTPGRGAAQARLVWARQKFKMGNYEEAEALFEDAKKMAGSDPEVRALVLRRTGTFWLDAWRQMKSGVRGGERVEAASQEKLDEAYQKAKGLLESAIELEPEESESYLLLGNLHGMNGENDLAIETFRKRLDMPFLRKGFEMYATRRDRYSLLLGLADQYITKTGQAAPGTAEQDELGAKADEQIDEALEELSSSMEAFFTRGRLYLALGKNREAIHWFESAEDLSRGLDWRNLYFLAIARLSDNQLGAAKDAITRAIEDRAAPSNCWVIYAKILLAENEPNQARLAAEQALALSPKNQDAMIIRAAAQEKLGQLDKATDIIREMQGDSPALVAGKAQYFLRRGDKDGALAQIEPAIEKHPAHPRVVEAAAMIYTELDRKDEAMEVINRALEQSPDDFDLEFIKIRFSDLEQEERVALLFEKVKKIKDEYRRAVRLASYFAGQEDFEKQYEQLAIAKQLVKDRATDAARRAGQSGLRGLIETMFSLAIKTDDTARMDELISEATTQNLDQANGLTFEGRRHLYNAFVANREARKAAAESRDADVEALLAEGRAQNEAAVEVLIEAIEKYPTNGQAFAGLGDAYRRLGEANEARIAYERVVELTPQNTKVLKQLVAIADTLGNEDDYRKWLDRCVEVMPEDPWVMERTLVAQEERNPRKGIARREEVLHKNPEDAGNLQKLAGLYARVGDVEKAEQRIDQLLTLPDANRYIGVAASLLRGIEKPDKALYVLQQYLWNAPADKRADAQLLIGDHHRAMQEIPAADTAYLAAADIDPSQKVFVAIGSHFTRTNRQLEADKWLQEALQKAKEASSPQKSRIQIMRIEVLTRARELEKAQALCDEYKTEYPDDPSSLYLESQIAMNRGDVDTTIEKLTFFLEQRPDIHIAVFNQAQALASVGEWQRALEVLEKLRASNPTALNFQPRILLAEAYDRVGRLDMAFQELESAYKDHPSATNVIDKLISLYVTHQRYSDADSVLTTLLNNNPNHVGWLLQSGDIALQQNDASKAIANQKQAVILGQFHPNLTATLLNTFSKIDAPDQGIAFFEEQVPPGRRSPLVLLAYAKLLGESGDVRGAIDTFRTALHKSGFDSFEFLERVAQSINSKLGIDQAIKLFNEPVDEVLEKSNKHILSALLQGSGKIDEAMDLCRTLLNTADSDREKSSIYLRLAVGHESKDELEKAREAYEQALAHDSENLFALNNLAYLLSDRLNRPSDALAYAKQAAELSNLSAVLDTLGWVYYQLGQYQDAVAQFTRIRRVDPGFIPASYHLAESFRRAGDFEKAEVIFAEVIEDGKGTAKNEFVAKSHDGLKLAKGRNSD